MTTPAKPRLAYIDWMRGLACVLMFQTHCYDSWLGGGARKSTFLRYTANTEVLRELLQFLYAECCSRNKAVEPKAIIQVCR